ncbi:MAG: hypothetical protein R3E89_03690 [Thiolinea sp.]
MKPVKNRSYWTLLQMLVLLVLAGALLFLNRDAVAHFFYTTHTGQIGLILNGLILLMFVFGLARMTLLFIAYAREQGTLNQFILRMRDRVANPAYRLPVHSLVVERYAAVQLITQQHALVDQSALATTVAASQSARFTLIRFVHNSLILTGCSAPSCRCRLPWWGPPGCWNRRTAWRIWVPLSPGCRPRSVPPSPPSSATCFIPIFICACRMPAPSCWPIWRK